MGDRFPVQTPDGVEMVRKDVVDGEAVVLTDEEGEKYQNAATGDAVEEVDEVLPVNAAATPMEQDGEKGDAPNLEREGMNREEAMNTLGPEPGDSQAEYVEDITLEQNASDSMTEMDEHEAVKEVEAEIAEATGTDATLTASEASALSPEEFVAGAEESTASDITPEQVEEAEEAVSEATHTEATLTESEVANILPEMQEEDEAPAEEAAEEEIDATPAAEALAAEEGIDLADVEGSGEEGRILKSDVEAAAADAEEA